MTMKMPGRLPEIVEHYDEIVDHYDETVDYYDEIIGHFVEIVGHFDEIIDHLDDISGRIGEKFDQQDNNSHFFYQSYRKILRTKSKHFTLIIDKNVGGYRKKCSVVFLVFH